MVNRCGRMIFVTNDFDSHREPIFRYAK